MHPFNSTRTPCFGVLARFACSAADRTKGTAVVIHSLGALPWMLRHAGALRPAFSCTRRAASRNRVRYPATSFASSPHAQAKRIPPSNTFVLSCCHLHHDARRKRDGSAMPPMPHVIRHLRFNGKGSERRERGILPSPVGAQRVSFSAEDAGAGAAKNKTEQSRMDEETRRSIGEGDEKAKKSMKTVKVSRVQLWVLIVVDRYALGGFGNSSEFRASQRIREFWYQIFLRACVVLPTLADE